MIVVGRDSDSRVMISSGRDTWQGRGGFAQSSVILAPRPEGQTGTGRTLGMVAAVDNRQAHLAWGRSASEARRVRSACDPHRRQIASGPGLVLGLVDHDGSQLDHPSADAGLGCPHGNSFELADLFGSVA